MQLIRVLFLSLLIVVSAVGHAKKFDPLDMPLPELEVIPGASAQWVGRQMAHNGMPMSIRMFKYPGTERDVSKFYRALFKAKGHGESQERNLGEYRVIGYELRGYIYSVQFKQQGAAVEGKLTVTPIAGRYRLGKATEMPVAPGCTVLNKVESLDYGKRSETVTLNCESRLRTVEQFYRNRLEGDGWSLVAVRKGELGSVIDFQRSGQIAQVTIKQFTKKNKRLINILINWVK